MVEIKFKKYPRISTTLTGERECIDYVVELNGFEIKRFCGYDNYGQHFNTDAEVIENAKDFVRDLANALNKPMPHLIHMVEKEITTTEWVEDGKFTVMR